MGKLSELAVKYKTDKWDHHFYTEHYEKALQHLKHEKFKLLEIGVGGYEFPDRGGASLNMWASYFLNAKIVGFDYYDKSKIQKYPSIKLHIGDQSQAPDLMATSLADGPFKVIIDDGSHINQHQIISFETLFPLLEDDGIYIIEDTETSYWKDYGGSEDLQYPHSCLAYFINKIHELHYRTNGMAANYFTENIQSIQFFNNIIIIRKGYNA